MQIGVQGALGLRAQKLSTDFVVADASYPSLKSVPGALVLTFQDYLGKDVTVDFENVCAFQWSEADAPLISGEPYDSVCEVFGSEWLGAHKPSNVMHSSGSVRQINLRFNAWGLLSVLCSGFQRRG